MSRIIQIAGVVFLLSIAHANAVQINLSGDYVDRYFRILQDYVLPLMVVSTIVLFCGYLASRVYHRTVTRKGSGQDDNDEQSELSEEGTEAFLRELRTAPPIEEPETKREPRLRPQHPLLRKRAVSAAAVLRARRSEEEAPQAQRTETVPVAGVELRLPLSRESAAPEPESSQTRRVPRVATPAPEEPRVAAPKTPQPPEPPRMAAPEVEAPRAPAMFDTRPETQEARDQRRYVVPPSPPSWDRDAAERAPREDRAHAAPPRESDAGEPERPKIEPPPVATTPIWSQESGGAHRAEPSATVIQALKRSPAPSPDHLEAARARAGEIADSLDYITSILQQGNTLVADHIKNKQGLELEDVRGMRVTAFDEPQGVLEDLRKLGGDIGSEVLSTYAAVAKFNNILRRLEQMAETEPLDEGWNDLLRARMSEILFVIGQVRKTLSGYRRGTTKSANAPDRPDDASGVGPEHPLPLGRKQV